MRFHGFFNGALAGVLFPVQHVGPGDFLFFRSHQGQFYLVLDVFNMHLATGLQAPADGLHHLLGDPVHSVVDAGGAGGLVAFYRKEGLGNGDGDLGRVKANEGAVAFDDLKGFCSGNRRGLGGQDGRHGTSPCVRVVVQPLRLGEGGGFCHGRTRKNEKKGTVLPRNPRKNTKGKDKKLFFFS